MTEEPAFTVGPPAPVTDSRQLPAVSAQDEVGFVGGADLGDAHPDNVDADLSADEGVGQALDDAQPEDAQLDDELPSEDDLDELVAQVDTGDVDTVGFDEIDLEEPVRAVDAGAQRGGS